MQRYTNLKVKTTVPNIFVPKGEILGIDDGELLGEGRVEVRYEVRFTWYDSCGLVQSML